MTYTLATWQVDASDSKSTVVAPYLATDASYAAKVTSPSGNATTTSFALVFAGTTGINQLVQQQQQVTDPAVSTSNNGSGSGNVRARFWNPDRTLAFEKTALGYIRYHEYVGGLETKTIDDADTSRTGVGEDFHGVTIPGGFSSSGSGLDSPQHHVSIVTYDAQGRIVSRTADSYTPLSYYTKLKDDRLVVLRFANSDGTPTFFGSVDYEVSNQAESVEATGLVGLTGNSIQTTLTSFIDETKEDPIQAIAVGTLRRLTTRLYDPPGLLVSESRLYTTIPSSLPGSSGTNYDSTTYAHDNDGRIIRTKEPSGTIRRTVFDARGNPIEYWLGTNDAGLPGSDSSGTANIVRTEAIQYDNGNDKGNGYATQHTTYVDDTPTSRVTQYLNDAFGNHVVVIPPASPYLLYKYDNRDRIIALGLYSSSTGLAIGSDPTVGTSANRMALIEGTYDEVGRRCRDTRHSIDSSSGNSVDTLVTDRWFDADGRMVKLRGSTLEKFSYDRLNRLTHEFKLASCDDNDAVYSNALDVSGDIVLEENETTFDPTDGKVIMRAVISRNHDDVGSGSTTGALDVNADANVLKYSASDVKGRIQITAIWNSLQGITDVVQYGTNGGSDLDRSGLAIPSRSLSALRTTYTYNTDGTIDQIQDPTTGAVGHFVKFNYDDSGRKTAMIRNYQSGSPTFGAPTDVGINVTTRWGYTNGLLTTVTADLPSGSPTQPDQVTTLAYGTTNGGSGGHSKIATGHLLHTITYPDSSDSGDVVEYAYDAQSEAVWRRDQAPSGITGNVIELDRDGLGRVTQRRVTTLGSNFDGAVRRIATTYDAIGRVQLVTQYDNAVVGSGSVTDEVRCTYDGLDNLIAFEEDRDSAVDAAGSVNDYEVDYTYEKNTSGVITSRRKTAALRVGSGSAFKTFTYTFSANYDNAVSRVSQVKDGSTVLAEYEYLGTEFVVGDNRPTPAVFSKQHSLTSAGTYTQLDNFNRRIADRWTKDLAADIDFYSVDNTWDENSNVVSTKDNIHTGFDVAYSMDGMNRVSEAKEGTLSGGSIGSTTRDQQWTLTQTGNWRREKLDLNGDGDFVDSNEHDDSRTHDDANELTAHDIDSNGSNDYLVGHDPAGNLNDDGKGYSFIYDAFYRLRKIMTRGGSPALVAEFRYNGLGHRIGEHYDNDSFPTNGLPDGVVDNHDHWYYTAYDEGWRAISTYRDGDSSPKEVFVPQQAGRNGTARSSYVNGVVCRYKDANTAWTAASDGILEQTYYYSQNWRGDVVAMISSAGKMVEWDKYSAYGTPFGLPRGDTDSDGDCDGTDVIQIQAWISASHYDVRGDLDLDGDVDSTDKTIAQGAAGSLGRSSLSGFGNRMGFAGYCTDATVAGLYHVRNRSFESDIGQWFQRDLLKYVGGLNLYEYCESKPVVLRDASGLFGGTPYRGPTDFVPPGLFPPSSPSGPQSTGPSKPVSDPGTTTDGIPNSPLEPTDIPWSSPWCTLPPECKDAGCNKHEQTNNNAGGRCEKGASPRGVRCVCMPIPKSKNEKDAPAPKPSPVPDMPVALPAGRPLKIPPLVSGIRSIGYGIWDFFTGEPAPVLSPADEAALAMELETDAVFVQVCADG